jgi:hypothetical protein
MSTYIYVDMLLLRLLFLMDEQAIHMARYLDGIYLIIIFTEVTPGSFFQCIYDMNGNKWGSCLLSRSLLWEFSESHSNKAYLSPISAISSIHVRSLVKLRSKET